jgi:hypothetical protein
MEWKKGQVSAEFSAVLAVQLLILALIMVIFGGIIAQMGIRSQYIVARDSVHLVADTAKTVWLEGAGSWRRITLAIPPNVQLSRSYIGNNTIDLFMLSFGDVTSAVPFNISGSLPHFLGSSVVDVTNNGSSVLVQPALFVDANTSAYYAEINKSAGGTSSLVVRITNSMNETYNVTPAPNPCGACGTCLVSPSTLQNVASGAHADFTISINCSSDSAGIHPGYMNFTIVPNDTTSALPNATYYLPITARVFT